MKKRFLLTSLFMMLFTFVAFASSTYAWFSMNTENKLNEFTLGSANATGGLEISNDGITFSKTEVEFESPESFASLDITTADGVNFYKADAVNAAGNPTSLSADTTGQGSDWYQFDLYFRTKVAGAVFIDFSKSYIVPASLKPEYENNAYTWNHTQGGTQNVTSSSLPVAKDADDTRLSSASGTNKFTTDWIAAAMRMSYQVTGYQNSTTSTYDPSVATAYTGTTAKAAQIFEPLSGFKLNSSNLGTYSISAEAGVDSGVKKVAGAGTTADPYDLDGGARNDNEWATGDGLCAATMYQVSGSTTSQTGKHESATKLTYNSADANNYQITKITFRLWVEGQDNAAQNALSGGKYAIALSFKLDSFGVAKNTVTISNPGAEIHTLEGTEQKVIEWTGFTQGLNKLSLVEHKVVESVDTYTVKQLPATNASTYVFGADASSFVYNPDADYMLVPELNSGNDTVEYVLGTTDGSWVDGSTTYKGFLVKKMITSVNPNASVDNSTAGSEKVDWTAIASTGAVDHLTLVKRVNSGTVDAPVYTYTTKVIIAAQFAAGSCMFDSEEGTDKVTYTATAEYLLVPSVKAEDDNANYEIASAGLVTWTIAGASPVTYIGWSVNVPAAPAE